MEKARIEVGDVLEFSNPYASWCTEWYRVTARTSAQVQMELLDQATDVVAYHGTPSEIIRFRPLAEPGKCDNGKALIRRKVCLEDGKERVKKSSGFWSHNIGPDLANARQLDFYRLD